MLVCKEVPGSKVVVGTQACMQEVGILVDMPVVDRLACTLEAGRLADKQAVGKLGCIVADMQADKAVRKQVGSLVRKQVGCRSNDCC